MINKGNIVTIRNANLAKPAAPSSSTDGSLAAGGTHCALMVCRRSYQNYCETV
jgi:hypothetical protein